MGSQLHPLPDPIAAGLLHSLRCLMLQMPHACAGRACVGPHIVVWVRKHRQSVCGEGGCAGRGTGGDHSMTSHQMLHGAECAPDTCHCHSNAPACCSCEMHTADAHKQVWINATASSSLRSTCRIAVMHAAAAVMAQVVLCVQLSLRADCDWTNRW